jgi:hypothetical protein
MPGKKYLTFDTATGKQKLMDSANSGGGDAALSGAILGLDANGRIDASFLPATNGQFSKSVVAAEALNAGDWIQVYYDRRFLLICLCMALPSCGPRTISIP